MPFLYFFAEDTSEPAKVLGGTLLFGIPWASSWKRIDWHFIREDKSMAPIFNGSASVLATLLFTGTVYQAPSEAWIWLPLYLGFIVATLVLTAYIGILYKYKDAVRQGSLWPILAGLVLYVNLWGIAAIYTRQIFIFHDYRVYGGVIQEKGLVKSTNYELFDGDGELIYAGSTDSNGKWLAYWKRIDEQGGAAKEAKKIGLAGSSTNRQMMRGEGLIDMPFSF
jgi:hypothetical protein